MSFSVLIFSPSGNSGVSLLCMLILQSSISALEAGMAAAAWPLVGYKRRDLAARTLVLYLGVETGSGMAPDNSPQGRQ